MDLPQIVRLNVQLTRACNQRCISCGSYTAPAGDGLSPEEFRELIDRAAELFPLKNIAFTGGEPTLYPELAALAAHARRRSDCVSITTNGSTFSSADALRGLIDAGVNRFTVSYHGIGSHDAFTRSPGHETRLRRVLGWLREEKAARAAPLYYKIGFLFTGGNLEELEAMLDYAEEMGAELYVELLDTHLPIFAQSPLAAAGKRCTAEQIDRACAALRRWKAEGRPVLTDGNALAFLERWYLGTPLRGECPLWSTDLYVSHQGDVYSGCWVLPPIGNIREAGLEALFSGPRFRENREVMQRRRCPGCTCGYLMQSRFLERETL